MSPVGTVLACRAYELDTDAGAGPLQVRVEFGVLEAPCGQWIINRLLKEELTPVVDLLVDIDAGAHVYWH